MNKNSLSVAQLDAISDLQQRLDDLRKQIGVADRGSILFRAEISFGDDECIIVEADGFGGAVLRIVDGVYPTDFVTRQELEYATEWDAVIAAKAFQKQYAE